MANVQNANKFHHDHHHKTNSIVSSSSAGNSKELHNLIMKEMKIELKSL